MAKKRKTDTLFVKSKVREYIKSQGADPKSDLLDANALNGAIIDMLNRTIGRAKANARKSISSRDL